MAVSLNRKEGYKMIKILKSIQKTELKFDTEAERFFSRHPFLGYLTAFIIMPLFILAAVFACTTAVIFPFALIFGGL